MHDFLLNCIHFTVLFQISLIDRVHKIYNDTVWQDRAVNIKIFQLFIVFFVVAVVVIIIIIILF